MLRLVDYKELCCCVLHLAENYTRYQHHIIFISNYIKQRKIPKGFRLKFHCNIANLEYENKIKKYRLKLMQRTVSSYKCSVLTMEAAIDKILGKVNYFHSNHWEALNREIKKHEKRLHEILAIRQKYERDHMPGTYLGLFW